eukprot:278140-Prorocentrum_minimum.AAC.2
MNSRKVESDGTAVGRAQGVARYRLQYENALHVVRLCKGGGTHGGSKRRARALHLRHARSRLGARARVTLASRLACGGGLHLRHTCAKVSICISAAPHFSRSPAAARRTFVTSQPQPKLHSLVKWTKQDFITCQTMELGRRNELFSSVMIPTDGLHLCYTFYGTIATDGLRLCRTFCGTIATD